MPQKKKEKRLKGYPASPGISIGEPFFYVHEVLSVPKTEVSGSEIQHEIDKYLRALKLAEENITNDQKNALRKGGKEAAQIFDAHLLIVSDQMLIEEATTFIKENKVAASYAVSKVMKQYQLALEKLENDYFSQRAFDVEDVCRRVIRNIVYEEQGLKRQSILNKKSIIVSNNILPSDAMYFDKKFTKGIVTEYGGTTSHAAILARSLGIPAVVGIHDVFMEIKNIETLIIDGDNGIAITNPEPETLKYYKELKKKQKKQRQTDIDEAKKEAITTDGVSISVASNIQSELDVDDVLKYSSDGIGLFRTEFIFERRTGILTEEEQFKIFDEIAERIYPKKVIFRLIDVGGDKLVGKVALHEPNPMLGHRGIRLLLEQQDLLLKPHVRAILRASSRKNVWIMVPFLTGLTEVRKTINIINKEAELLKKEGHNIDENFKFGTMIEIPSAAIISDHIAKSVDFFSIGTNDLTQYVMAADRDNDKVADIYDPLHPSVIRLINMTLEAAKKREINISVCGLMATSKIAIPLLLGLGLREVSVPPFQIPEIKKIVRSVSIADCEKLATRVLKHNTKKEIKRILTTFYSEKVEKDIVKYL